MWMMKRRDNSVTGINSFLMRVLVATRQTETSDYYVIRWSRSVVRYLDSVLLSNVNFVT